MSGNWTVCVVDALRAPYHDFVPRFFCRDCLGSRYDGGECGARPGGVHSGRPFRPRSGAGHFANPKNQQRRCLRCTLRLSPTHAVQEGKCISASDCQEPVSASQCNHVRPASGRPLNFSNLNASFGSLKLVAQCLLSDRPRDLLPGSARRVLQLGPEYVPHLVDRSDHRPRRQTKPHERSL